MLEAITLDGTTVTAPDQSALAEQAEAFGGIVATFERDSTADAVLTIMEGAEVGTVLTEADGTSYLLTPAGWYTPGSNYETIVPPYETIVAATFPSGRTWSA